MVRSIEIFGPVSKCIYLIGSIHGQSASYRKVAHWGCQCDRVFEDAGVIGVGMGIVPIRIDYWELARSRKKAGFHPGERSPRAGLRNPAYEKIYLSVIFIHPAASRNIHRFSPWLLLRKLCIVSVLQRRLAILLFLHPVPPILRFVQPLFPLFLASGL